MEVAVWAVVLMLLGHWFADFVFQPHWMGMRKSKEWWVLIQHGLRITAGGLATTLVIDLFYTLDGGLLGMLAWAVLNGVAHIAIDAVTSRITGHFYAKNDMHHFFSVIGFDQFLHLALAVVTLAIFVL